jgi:hypothetical protein
VSRASVITASRSHATRIVRSLPTVHKPQRSAAITTIQHRPHQLSSPSLLSASYFYLRHHGFFTVHIRRADSHAPALIFSTERRYSTILPCHNITHTGRSAHSICIGARPRPGPPRDSRRAGIDENYQGIPRLLSYRRANPVQHQQGTLPLLHMFALRCMARNTVYHEASMSLNTLDTILVQQGDHAKALSTFLQNDGNELKEIEDEAPTKARKRSSKKWRTKC